MNHQGKDNIHRCSQSTTYEDMSDDELAWEIHKHWADFIKHDLTVLDTAIKAQQWL